MLVGRAPRHRPRASASTPSGPCSAPSRISSGIFDGIEDAYLRERKGDVADVVGRLRMNLRRARGLGADLFRDVEADVGAHRRRADAVDGRAGGLAEDPGVRHRHRQPHAPHRHPRALAPRARRSSACGDASAASRPARPSIIDGTTGEVIVDPPDDARGRRAGAAARARVGPSTAPARSLAPAPRTADGVRITPRGEHRAAGRPRHRARRGRRTASASTARSSCSRPSPADSLTEDAQYARLPGAARGHGAGRR